MSDEIEFYLDRPGELNDLLAKASAGDRSTLTQLRDLFAAVPGLSAKLGDISMMAEKQLVTQLAGTNLVKQEAITHALDALETSLKEGVQGTTAILIRQVRNDMLMLSSAQQRAIERRDVISDRLLSTAHRRLLTSLKTLHTLQRVLPKIQVNIGANQINM